MHCSTASAATCSGSEDVYSVMTDYRWTKRFDTYAGVMLSRVFDGLASGFLNTSTADPMVGFRFGSKRSGENRAQTSVMLPLNGRRQERIQSLTCQRSWLGLVPVLAQIVVMMHCGQSGLRALHT